MTQPEDTAYAEEVLVTSQLAELLQQHEKPISKELTIELFRQGLISYSIMQRLFDALNLRGA